MRVLPQFCSLVFVGGAGARGGRLRDITADESDIINGYVRLGCVALPRADHDIELSIDPANGDVSHLPLVSLTAHRLKDYRAASALLVVGS